VCSNSIMEIGPVVIGMSLIASVYILIAIYLVTRTMWRCVRNTPALPVRLCITFDEHTRSALLKKA